MVAFSTTNPAASIPIPLLLTTDRILLESFLRLDQDLEALAAETKQSMLDLVPWFTNSAVQAHLAIIQSALHLARFTTALNELEAAVKSSKDSVERRRAATTLLRALKADPHPTSFRATGPDAARGVVTRADNPPSKHSPDTVNAPPLPPDIHPTSFRATGPDAARGVVTRADNPPSKHSPDTVNPPPLPPDIHPTSFRATGLDAARGVVTRADNPPSKHSPDTVNAPPLPPDIHPTSFRATGPDAARGVVTRADNPPSKHSPDTVNLRRVRSTQAAEVLEDQDPSPDSQLGSQLPPPHLSAFGTLD